MGLSGLSLSVLQLEFLLDCEAFKPLVKELLDKRTDLYEGAMVLMEAEGSGMHPTGQYIRVSPVLDGSFVRIRCDVNDGFDGFAPIRFPTMCFDSISTPVVDLFILKSPRRDRQLPQAPYQPIGEADEYTRLQEAQQKHLFVSHQGVGLVEPGRNVAHVAGLLGLNIGRGASLRHLHGREAHNPQAVDALEDGHPEVDVHVEAVGLGQEALGALQGNTIGLETDKRVAGLVMRPRHRLAHASPVGEQQNVPRVGATTNGRRGTQGLVGPADKVRGQHGVVLEHQRDGRLVLDGPLPHPYMAQGAANAPGRVQLFVGPPHIGENVPFCQQRNSLVVPNVQRLAVDGLEAPKVREVLDGRLVKEPLPAVWPPCQIDTKGGNFIDAPS